MKLTARDKQLWLPLLVFVTSFTLYALLLGSIWVIAVVPFMAGSVGVFGYYNFDRLTKSFRDWMERDD